MTTLQFHFYRINLLQRAALCSLSTKVVLYFLTSLSANASLSLTISWCASLFTSVNISLAVSLSFPLFLSLPLSPSPTLHEFLCVRQLLHPTCSVPLLRSTTLPLSFFNTLFFSTSLFNSILFYRHHKRLWCDTGCRSVTRISCFRQREGRSWHPVRTARWNIRYSRWGSNNKGQLISSVSCYHLHLYLGVFTFLCFIILYGTHIHYYFRSFAVIYEKVDSLV